MNSRLNIAQRNKVLLSMAALIKRERSRLLAANALDVKSYDGNDIAMYDRLKVDENKIEDMIMSLQQLADEVDPLGKELYHFTQENGLDIRNKTAPFGTVLIIYESRPDVTVEATGIAFKSGNRILLKGGKESLNSNLCLVALWHEALEQCSISIDWIVYLNYNRKEIQTFLKAPSQKIDVIVPRGGDKLIAFVKQHASYPVIVSGRGNNFIYVDDEADFEQAIKVIINGKTAKISACNAIDKVLINRNIQNYDFFVKSLVKQMKTFDVEVLGDEDLITFEHIDAYNDGGIWYEEFLDYKILLGTVQNSEEAIAKINKYSGGHSAVIITENQEKASLFMESVDAAAVYQNASSRFTDGGQFGLGGELAISTDKLHHRGPLGMQQLVTNKWYITGHGQIR